MEIISSPVVPCQLNYQSMVSRSELPQITIEAGRVSEVGLVLLSSELLRGMYVG